MDPLKYQAPRTPKTEPHALAREWLTLKLRYKQPDGDKSQLISHTVEGQQGAGEANQGSANFQWSAAVAAFGMLLRDSTYKGTTNVGLILDLARPSVGQDQDGLRSEFLELVEKARKLMPEKE